MITILFVGDLNRHGRSLQRYKALKRLGHRVIGISTVVVPQRPGIEKISFRNKLRSKLRRPIDKTHANREAIRVAASEKPDIVWIEKGNTIKPSTLKTLKRIEKKAVLLSLSEDNMCARHNYSVYYRKGLACYDLVCTTKPHNVEGLKKMGARRAILFLDAYDRTLHHPVRLTEEELKRYACGVGFIGTYEKQRAEWMWYLAKNDIPVTIWGNGWESAKSHPNLEIKSVPLYEKEFVKAINATAINLGFLRKMNKDTSTSRSVEIPACGGFLLAENTKKHQELFRENEEVVLFDSQQDLLEKTRYYTRHEKERRRIREAGRNRCVRSGYNHETQMSNIIKEARHVLRSFEKKQLN